VLRHPALSSIWKYRGEFRWNRSWQISEAIIILAYYFAYYREVLQTFVSINRQQYATYSLCFASCKSHRFHKSRAKRDLEKSPKRLKMLAHNKAWRISVNALPARCLPEGLFRPINKPRRIRRATRRHQITSVRFLRDTSSLVTLPRTADWPITTWPASVKEESRTQGRRKSVGIGNAGRSVDRSIQQPPSIMQLLLPLCC